jgi:hypothetical protein
VEEVAHVVEAWVRADERVEEVAHVVEAWVRA